MCTSPSSIIKCNKQTRILELLIMNIQNTSHVSSYVIQDTENNKKYVLPKSEIATQKPTDISQNKKPENSFLEELSQNKLKESMREYISGSGKEVHEEQLQFILVNSILSSKSKKLGDEYSKIFSTLSAHSRSTEDNVKGALKELVAKDLMSITDAEAIHGITFKAAQLDTNLNALYDGTAGPNDNTKATADVQVAIDSASKMIQQIREGKESFENRSLDLASNSVQRGAASSGEINSSTAVHSGPAAEVTATPTSGKGGNGFLWKPASDNNGRLVVLMPPELAGRVVSTEVHSSLPPSDSSLIEKGNYSGNGNGGRDHFRFSKSGGSYPDGLYVIATLSNGQYVSYNIPETNARNVK